MKTEQCRTCGHPWFLHRHKIVLSQGSEFCKASLYDEWLDASLSCGCEGFR